MKKKLDQTQCAAEKQKSFTLVIALFCTNAEGEEKS
jgi:hypothetical protein